MLNNSRYPEIATDYEKMFRVLQQLPCDIFLGAHGGYFNMEAKFAQLKNGGANPFLDPEGYKSYVRKRTDLPLRTGKTNRRGKTLDFGSVDIPDQPA